MPRKNYDKSLIFVKSSVCRAFNLTEKFGKIRKRSILTGLGINEGEDDDKRTETKLLFYIDVNWTEGP